MPSSPRRRSSTTSSQRKCRARRASSIARSRSESRAVDAMLMAAVRRRYEQALEWLVIALMAVLAIEVTTGVAFRSAGYSLTWYDEVASILLAWLTFYGSASRIDATSSYQASE